MIIKWNYCLAAGLLVGFFMIRGGVAPLPVAAGIGGAALLTLLLRLRAN